MNNLFEVIKKRNRGKERGQDAGQCHISIFPLCSIAQARFGEVRFSEQETDLERKSLTFIYITQTFSTGNSWGSVCLLLVLSYSLRILGTWSNNVISPRFFFFLFFQWTRCSLDLSQTWLDSSSSSSTYQNTVVLVYPLKAQEWEVKDKPKVIVSLLLVVRNLAPRNPAVSSFNKRTRW